MKAWTRRTPVPFNRVRDERGFDIFGRSQVISRVCIALLLVALAAPTGTSLGGSVMDAIVKRGGVRIGVPYNRAPQGFFNTSGQWVGFEVDMATEMARHMNLKLEMVKANDKTWGQLLSSGQIDAAMCRIRHTRSLDGQFDFSVPYFFDALHVLVVKGKFGAVAELSGSKIAAVQGSVAEKEAMKLLRDAGDRAAEKNVVSFPDGPSCFMALGRDKVAAWVDSGVGLLEYASKTPGRFELLKVGDVVEPIAVALPQDDSAWRDLVNFTIQDMAADGSLKKIYDTWFGPDTPHHFPPVRSVEIWPE